MKINKLITGVVALMIVFGGMSAGDAAEKKQNAVKAPIVVEGDNLSFNDLTGEVYAGGKVVVMQNGAVLKSEVLHGNTKTGEMHVDGAAVFEQPGTKLTGQDAAYNYKTHNGSMHTIAGTVDKQIVAGNSAQLAEDKITIYSGTATRCPAKIPDYHVSADRIEIWPGDKMIAYNAKFWIKNKVIFTMAKYQKSLKKGAESDFPRIGYTNDDGFYIKQYIEYPVSGNVAAFTDLAYYTKAGFKPIVGAIDWETNYSLGVYRGEYRDGDGNWITKEPEFRLSYYPRRLGSLPVSYSFTAVYGKWTDSAKSSWHQDYNLYFTRDTIKLSDTLSLNLGTGFELVRESYDKSTQNIFKFDSTLTKVWSPKFTGWVGYHYTKNNNTLFDYEKTDLGRELNTGFSYKIDRLNTIVFSQSHDLKNNRIYDQDYTWHRDLHCWQAAITYRAKRDQWTWDFSVTRW